MIEKQANCLIVLAFLVVAINHKSIHADCANIVSFFNNERYLFHPMKGIKGKCEENSAKENRG